MKTFLKSADLQLLNGGYLSDSKGNPVYNADFVAMQQHAEYIVTFASVAKGKNFEVKKVDSLSDVVAEVAALMSKNKPTQFVTKPEHSATPLTDKLKDEALAFINSTKVGSKIDKINDFLQQFVTLKEFEEFGLFFESDVVKLNKIYTVAEITDAVTECIDLLK